MATRQLKHFLFLACLVLATKAETQELIFCAGLDPDFAIHDRTKDIKENLLPALLAVNYFQRAQAYACKKAIQSCPR
jgi:hypothetical protein